MENLVCYDKYFLRYFINVFYVTVNMKVIIEILFLKIGWRWWVFAVYLVLPLYSNKLNQAYYLSFGL